MLAMDLSSVCTAIILTVVVVFGRWRDKPLGNPLPP
jgi:hypothetical protein